jgi:phage-related baseplate assembly protein
MLLPRYSVIDPARLGRMIVLETLDSEATLRDRMLRLKAIWSTRDPPAGAQYDVENLEFDPLKINQEVNTFCELLLRDRVNEAARAVTLAYAISTDLDAIASRYPGGVPRLTGESDDHYRRRIWASPNPLSPHGVAESYAFWGLTALGGIMRDVTATKTRRSLRDDPIIVITCMKEGANPVPTPSELIEVRRYIIDEKRAGATDVISIRGPIVRDINYTLGLWLYPGPDAQATIAAVQASLAALVEKQRWLGYDHMIDAIRGAVMLQDVHSMELEEPLSDTRVDPTGLVRVNQISVRYLGRRE